MNINCRAHCFNKSATGECLSMPCNLDEDGHCEDFEQCACIGCPAVEFRPYRDFKDAMPYCTEQNRFILEAKWSCGNSKAEKAGGI